MRGSTAWLLVGLMVIAWGCGGEGGATDASDVGVVETETDGTNPPEATEVEEPGQLLPHHR